MSWLGFDLINDAIAKAKTELEKSVDNALGIEKEQGAGSSLPTGPGAKLAAAEASTLDQAHVQPPQEGHGAGQQQPANGKAAVAVPNGSTADGQPVPAAAAVAPKVVKKVIKKVIKKVPKAQPAADGLAKAPSTDPASLLPSVSSAAELTPLGEAALAAGAPAAELEAQLSPAISTVPSNASLQAHDSLQVLALPVSIQSQTQLGSTMLQPQETSQAASANSSSWQGQGTPAPASNRPGDTAAHQLLLTPAPAAQNGYHSADSQGAETPSSSQHQLPATSGHSPSALPEQQAAAADTAVLDTPGPDNSKRKGHKSLAASGQHAPKHVMLPPQPALGSQVSRKQSLDEPALTPAPQPLSVSANHSRKQSLDGSRPWSQPGAGDGAASGPQGSAGGLIEPQLTAVNVHAPGDLQQLSHGELVAMVAELQEQVAARDERLGRQAGAMCELQQVVAQLQDRNEALALKTASISEQDWEEMRKEFEQRLATAERKVYALNKERDALKRGNEKLSDYGALIKEKDGIIKQVMDEGERLSARQAELESTQKKLRGQIKDLEMERDKLSHKLASEEAGAEALRRAKAKLERDLQTAQEHAAQELEQARLQADSLLLKARADQAEAEERAREAANAGLHRKLRESEARSEALSETVIELREALDRQRQAADLREEMLKQDLADLERRCQGAELRHQELAAKLPDATRPLLRQIEAMQAAADAQAGAWAAAEQSLASRIDDAEGRAAAAAERERHASERAQTLQARAAGLEAALGAARMELKSLMEQVDLAGHASSSLQQQLNDARQAAQLEAEHAKLARQQLQQIEDKHATALLVEHQARQAAEGDAATVRKEYERRLAELEAQLNEARGGTGGGGGGSGGGMFGGESSSSRGGAPDPPAMAAPGYRWVLQKEGESPKHSQARPHDRHDSHLHNPFATPALQEPSSDGGALPIESSAAELWSSLVPANSMMGGGMPLASELESMRATLRIRGGEVASLEAQVRALEATRDRLSEELVAAAQKSEEAATALMTVDALHKEVAELKTRYVACVELLGERDEALEELRDDLMDVKNLYREQIEFMVHQLTGRRPGEGAPPQPPQPPATEPA